MGSLKLTIPAAGSIILKIKPKAPVILNIQFDDGDEEKVNFPANITEYLRLTNGPVPITGISCEDGEIVAPGAIERLGVILRLRFMEIVRRRRMQHMRQELPLARGGAVEHLFLTKEQLRHGKLLQQLGLTLNQNQSPGSNQVFSPILASNIRRLNSEKSIEPAPIQMPKLSFAISIHLYYTEMWPEIREILSSIDESPRLFITMCENADSRKTADKIRKFSDGANILYVENRGRDILPFLTQLNSGLFDPFDLICKIHTKASTGLKGGELLGEVWRRRMLLDLLGGQSQLESALRIFGSDETVGMAGPPALRTSNARMGDPATPRCLELRDELAQRAFGRKPPPIDYYAGTMFWVRREMLDPIRKLQLTTDDFESEAQLGLEGMPHALERFFADCVRMSGGKIVDMPEY